MTTLRVVWTGLVVHFKITSRSPFAIGVGALHGARARPLGGPDRQLARVSGLDRERLALPDRRPPRLVAPDLVGARNHVGHASAAPRGTRRPGLARPRDVRAALARLRRDRLLDRRSLP